MFKPLLHPHHFSAKSVLRLGDRGFEADFIVDSKARHSFSLGCKTDTRATRREQFLEQPVTRLLINPQRLPPRQLRAHFQVAARQNQGPFDFRRFLRGRRDYPTRLSIGPRYFDDDGDVAEDYLPEGQTIVLVGFEGDQPRGFIGLHLSATQSSIRNTVTVDVLLDWVSTASSSDESHHVLDLTIGACRVIESLIEAVYRAAPRGAELRGSIDGDVQGVVGRCLAAHLHARMLAAFDVLGRRESRRTVSFGEVQNHLASNSPNAI